MEVSQGRLWARSLTLKFPPSVNQEDGHDAANDDNADGDDDDDDNDESGVKVQYCIINTM